MKNPKAFASRFRNACYHNIGLFSEGTTPEEFSKLFREEVARRVDEIKVSGAQAS
jgi:hypothetical protein